MSEYLQGCVDRVLIYNPALERRDSRVRDCYIAWRKEHGPDERCDNPECRFFVEPLIWNNKKLLLIVDHKSGNFRDSRPDNLQFVCPNCAVQLPTQGSRNVGQVVFQLLESYGLKTGEINLMLSDLMNNLQDGCGVEVKEVE